MGETVGHDIALALFLQPVVADRRRGRQAFLDIAGLDDMLLPIGAIGLDAGETIRHQFDPYRFAARALL